MWFLFWANFTIINPIKNLEERVADFAENSHGLRDASSLRFKMPKLYIKNEVYRLAEAVNKMTWDIRDYIYEVIKAEKKADLMQHQADQMSELANKDSLTGIRNKTAYDKEIKKIEYDLNVGKPIQFGLGMIDLNFLKKINDSYGHERGNIAIKKLCQLVCTVFDHSPVFRIGGDEFIIILKDSDYENIEELISEFNRRLEEISKDTKLEPWEKVSAAIGFAFYDKDIDNNVLDVFRRADENMYKCKRNMKAARKD